MSKPPLSLEFNLPFSEAIKAAERVTTLPSDYYNPLRQGIYRQKAFSIAGIAAIDQLQAVNDSLQAWMKKGGSFAAWKKQTAVMNLNLPRHRLENIWRTNLQGNYMRGRWTTFTRNAELRPYLMYDAINDSRTRKNHLAMDGVIRPIGDPFWKTHTPPCGFNCRCSLLSLSEAQASARSGFNAQNEGLGLNKVPTNEDGSLAEPDPGWDYNPYEDGLKVWNPDISRFPPKFRPAAEKVMAGAEELAVDKQLSLIVDNALMHAIHDDQIRKAIASAQFDDFFNAAASAPSVFAVAALTDADRQLFNCKNDTLLLSRTTLDQHKESHPDVTIEDYRRIPDIIAKGKVWGGHARQRFVLLWIGDKPYRAAIKTDATDTQAWFLSLVRSTKQKPPKGSKRLR